MGVVGLGLGLGRGGMVKSDSSSTNPSSSPSSILFSSNWSGVSVSPVVKGDHVFPVCAYKYSTPNFSPVM